jgi:hypothetical protein
MICGYHASKLAMCHFLIPFVRPGLFAGFRKAGEGDIK